MRDKIEASVLLILLRCLPYLLWLGVAVAAWALGYKADLWMAVFFFCGWVAGNWNAQIRADKEIPSLVTGLREIWG